MMRIKRNTRVFLLIPELQYRNMFWINEKCDPRIAVKMSKLLEARAPRVVPDRHILPLDLGLQIHSK